MYVCMYVCMSVYIWPWVYVCMYVCMYVWIPTNSSTPTKPFVCMYVCMYMYVYRQLGGFACSDNRRTAFSQSHSMGGLHRQGPRETKGRSCVHRAKELPHEWEGVLLCRGERAGGKACQLDVCMRRGVLSFIICTYIQCTCMYVCMLCTCHVCVYVQYVCMYQFMCMYRYVRNLTNLTYICKHAYVCMNVCM